MVFTTPRLLVRSLSEDDLPHFYELHSSNSVMKYVGGVSMTLEESKKDLEKILAFYDRPGNDFRIWAVSLKQDKRFIGTCAMVKNEKEENEIGFRFLETFWGRGYGRELVEGMIAYSFKVLQLQQIVAYVNNKNIASVRILERYFNFMGQVYNEKEGCTDRLYVVYNDGLS